MAIRPVNRDSQDFTHPSSSRGPGRDETLDFVDDKGNIVASLISDADGSKSLEVDGEAIEPLSALSTVPTATAINPATDKPFAKVMTVVVAGAGTEAANGTYTYRGQYEGKPFYTLEGQVTPTDPSLDESSITWLAGTTWGIGNASGLYASDDDTDYPWQGTFTASNGDLPAPTLTAVPVTMQVSREVLTGFQSAVLTEDFAKTDDTLTAVTDLTLNLEAGKTYRVTGRLQATSGDDLVYALLGLHGGTATVIGLQGVMRRADDMGTFQGLITSITDSFQTNYDGWYEFDLTVEVDAGGTFVIQFSQGATNAAASTLKKYSTITAQRLD